jgi:hypothetical protein
MSYTHPFLSHAIDYHFGGVPPEGIRTVDGALVEWLAPNHPTEEELRQWVDTYLAAPPSDPVKNRRMALESEIDACTTLAQVRALLKKRLR